MEKILINKQTNKTRKDIILVEKLCERINETLISEFLKLGVSEFTPDLLNDALFEKSEKTIELLKKQANEEMAKVKNIVIKSVYERAVTEQIENYIHSTKIDISVDEEFLLKYITISDNKATLIKDYREKITTENYYCIETPEELAIYNALLKIAEGINEFNNSLSEKVKSHVILTGYYRNFLIMRATGVIELDTDTDIKFLVK